jgi:hypothetical protein
LLLRLGEWHLEERPIVAEGLAEGNGDAVNVDANGYAVLGVSVPHTA